MKNKKNRYTSRYNLGGKKMYQLGGVEADTTLTPIQRGQQLGLFSTPQIQKITPQKNAILEQAKLRNAQKNKLNTIKMRNAAAPRAVGPAPATENYLNSRYFQTGGMYGSNQIPAGIGSTAMTVYQESDPAVQKQREEDFQEDLKIQQEEGDKFQSDLDVLEQENKLKLEAAAAQVGAGFETGAAIASKGVEGIAKIKKLQDAAKAKEALAVTGPTGPSGQTGLETGEKVVSGLSAGTSATAIPVGIAAPSATAGYGAGLIGPPTLAQAQAMGYVAPSAAGTGAGLGASLGKWATSGAGVGTIASLAGMGISHLADDDDPTKSNVGEYSGSIISSAGTGMAIGSTLGPVGTLVGGIAGGLYGAGKQYFGTKAAKKEERKQKEEWEEKVTDYNEELAKNYGMQKGSIRAGNIKQKTYSGYDLGRNVVAQLGGMRMGIPRYRYAA